MFSIKSIKTIFLLLIVSTAVSAEVSTAVSAEAGTAISAETIYIGENLRLNIRTGASNKHKIIDMLLSGTPLTVISRDEVTGYTKVVTAKGIEGYVLTRYTQTTPTARQLLKRNNEQLAKFKTKNQQLKKTLLALQSDDQSNTTNNKRLTTERDHLSQELQELKQTVGSAIQIKQQRDQLQERVVNIERKNQQLKREKQTLEVTSNQDWFLNGGIVAFLGIFLGLLIPKISWHRKRSSWDSF